MRHGRSMVVLALAGLTLAGCDDPTKTRHEKIVRCTGFSTALLAADPQDPTIVAAGGLVQSKYSITDADTVPMGKAAVSYAAAMDPARATALTSQGKADATDLVAKKDAQGIADYTKSCVDTFHALGSK